MFIKEKSFVIVVITFLSSKVSKEWVKHDRTDVTILTQLSAVATNFLWDFI